MKKLGLVLVSALLLSGLISFETLAGDFGTAVQSSAGPAVVASAVNDDFALDFVHHDGRGGRPRGHGWHRWHDGDRADDAAIFLMFTALAVLIVAGSGSHHH